MGLANETVINHVIDLLTLFVVGNELGLYAGGHAGGGHPNSLD